MKIGERFIDANGVEWESMVNDNPYTPEQWPIGWRRVEEPIIEPLTLQQLQHMQLLKETLGVAFELTPDQTYDISRELNLPPIADGKAWKPGLNLAAGTIVIHAGQNYIVIQAHISQSTWSPDLVPALFERIREAYAEWVQPEGGHDAYMVGDVVMHDGVKWRSIMDYNVWTPGVFGWEEV